MQRLAVEFRSAALGAYRTRQELFGPVLSAGSGGIVLQHLDVLDHTVKGEEIVAGAERLGAQVQALVGAVENVVKGLLRQLAQRCVQCTAVFLANSGYLPEYLHILVFSQWGDAAFVDTDFVVGNHLLQIYLVDDAQSLAMRTGSLGRVE